MEFGTFTQYVDLAQLVLYLFWAFFAGLIYYLVRENHREGYPMEVEGDRGITVTGWPVPKPKSYVLPHGGTLELPSFKTEPVNYSAEPYHGYIGAPLVPVGDAMLAGVGPGSWVQRADVPDLDPEGRPKIQPLRLLGEFGVSPKDVDPRGLPVLGADGEVGGTVCDLWVDRCEAMFRYLEVETADAKRVLLPMPFARVGKEAVKVKAIMSHQFGQVPQRRQVDWVTLLEEEKICAYYGGGTLYADPERAEPLV